VIRPLIFQLSVIILLLIGPFSSLPSKAHTFVVTDVVALLKTNGTYVIDLTVDLDALALGVSPATPSSDLVSKLLEGPPDHFETAVANAVHTLQRRVNIRFDGKKQLPDVGFPDATGLTRAQAKPVDRAGEPTLLGLTARLSGPIPLGALDLQLGLSRAFGPVNLTVLEQGTASGFRTSLSPGELSKPYRLGSLKKPEQGRLRTAVRFLILGVEHILPLGLDHILFVLGLFLLSTLWRPLLTQVTAFTIAHTLTLVLSIYEMVSLPSTIVEPLIALSITFVAVENILTSRMKPWRLAVVFSFGLIHGLGFAAALRELGLPEGEFLISLLTFNLGVEIGQLAVIGLAFLAVGWLRSRIDYRRFVVIPASGVIAIVGLVWAIERTFFR